MCPIHSTFAAFSLLLVVSLALGCAHDSPRPVAVVPLPRAAPTAWTALGRAAAPPDSRRAASLRITRLDSAQLHADCRGNGCPHSAISEYGTGGCHHLVEACPEVWRADLDGDGVVELIMQWHGGIRIYRPDPPQCAMVPCQDELFGRGGFDNSGEACVGSGDLDRCDMVLSFDVVTRAMHGGPKRPVVRLRLEQKVTGTGWTEVVHCHGSGCHSHRQ